MNRPKQEDYLEDTIKALITGFDYEAYTDALEKHCDYLEEALDNACKELSFEKRETYKKGTMCPIKANWCVDTKECWICLKEWFLKGEV